MKAKQLAGELVEVAEVESFWRSKLRPLRGYSSINTILGRQRSGEERLQETPEILIDDGISLADATTVERFDKPGRYFIRPADCIHQTEKLHDEQLA